MQQGLRVRQHDHADRRTAALRVPPRPPLGGLRQGLRGRARPHPGTHLLLLRHEHSYSSSILGYLDVLTKAEMDVWLLRPGFCIAGSGRAGGALLPLAIPMWQQQGVPAGALRAS
jgi:hypothetical protein